MPELKIKLKPFQDEFLFSKARYPAMVSGWGTGKTMLAIFRAMYYSELIPNNLGVIFRKEYTDLRDSTVKDFEKYTGLKVDSKREVVLPNGSVIMFRHIEEINNIQNINLGWFYIEQAEELETDLEFFTLWGRLRRELTPTQAFTDLGISIRSGWCIANAGSDWMSRVWREDQEEGYSLTEAKTWANAENLPKDFLDSLKLLKHKKPAIYDQYVENDWNVDQGEFIIIPKANVEALKGLNPFLEGKRSLVSCDPAYGGDEAPIFRWLNYDIIKTQYMFDRDTMKLTGQIMLMAANPECKDIAIDIIGVGKGVGDRLDELGKNVQHLNSAQKKGIPEEFLNLRAQMWFYAAEKIQNLEIPYPRDPELRRQLCKVKYKMVDSSGMVKVEPKADTKKRIGCSPDRADNFIYGIWGLQFVNPESYLATRSRGGRKKPNAMTA